MMNTNLVSHLNQAAKNRLAEVIEARQELREAVQTSNQADVIWWMKELTLRQSFLRRATDDAEWAALHQ